MQVVTQQGNLDFVPELHNENDSELRRVIRSLKRIRNNLFHGGKHGAKGEEDIDRNKFLLNTGVIILNQLSVLDYHVEGDYRSAY